MRELRVAFGRTLALDHVTVELNPGTSTALIGANGSGKTTLLNVLAGLLAPSAGELWIDPTAGPTAYLLQRRDEHRWMPLTVSEVLRMGRYPVRGALGRMRPEDRRVILDSARRLEVDSLLAQQFGTLSGGQRQRVMMAQALTRAPGILLLDEPITGLDIASQQRILEVMDEEAARGTTVVLSTHHLEEANRCDRVILLARRVVADGPPSSVLSAPNLEIAFSGRTLALGERGHVVLVDDHGHDHRAGS